LTKILWALLALLLAPASASADPIALATIVEGQTVLLRGQDRFALAEGVRLERGDIVETGPAAPITRIEFDDGPVLDLGPDTRVLLAPRFARDRRERPGTVYLALGWAKLTLGEGPATEGVGIAGEAADLSPNAGVIVAHVVPGAVALFQESGSASVSIAPGTAAPRALKAGQSLTLAKGTVTVLPRVAPALLDQLPRTFRDTLPLRAARFKGVSKQPKPLAPPTYDDLAPWLQSERSLRIALLPRWRGLEAGPDFRRALVRNLRLHPEWRPILFPPPPPPPPSAPYGPAVPSATR
jgi:hypothetical protein